MKKIFITGLCILIFLGMASFVNAAAPFDDVDLVFDFDGEFKDSVHEVIQGTSYGAGIVNETVNCANGNCMEFDGGAGAFFNYTAGAVLPAAGYSISWWNYHNQTLGVGGSDLYQCFFNYQLDDTTYQRLLWEDGYDDGNRKFLQGEHGSDQQRFNYEFNEVGYQEWCNHIIIYYGGGKTSESNYDYYVCGMNITAKADYDALGGTGINQLGGSGTYQGDPDYMFQGLVDEMYLWNRTLDASEIATLNTTFYSASSPATCTNMTITATDVESGAVSGFYVNVTYNGTMTTWSNLTGGTITTDICTEDQEFANITWFNFSWFDDAETNYNCSTNYVADNLYQAVVNIRGTEIMTNDTITPDTTHTNGQADALAFKLLAKNQNVTIEKATYYNFSGNITPQAMDSGTFYYLEGMYQTILSVGANNISSGVSLMNFDVNFSAINNTYTNNTAVTSGVGTFYLLYDDYNITVDATDFTGNNSYLEIYATTYTFNASLYHENTINFTFYDEETGAIINDRNVTIELIGSTYAYNRSTESGSLVLELLYPDSYTIRYSADEYDERFYYFTLEDDSVNWLDLYLLNSSSATIVIPTVYDEGSFPLESAEIRVLKYDVATNSYILYEMCETNFEGECPAGLHLIPVSEFYKFFIYYDIDGDGTKDLRKETTPTYIKTGTTTIAFQITTEASPTENYYLSQGIAYQLSFLTATNYFRYFYSDTNAVAAQGCLYIYQETWNAGSTLINSSCTSGASGTILINIDDSVNATYRAKATVWFGTSEEFIDSMIYSIDTTTNVFGKYGLIIIAVIMVIFAFMGVWNPIVATILFPLPLFFGRVAGLTHLSWAAIIPIMAGSWIITFIISRRS